MSQTTMEPRSMLTPGETGPVPHTAPPPLLFGGILAAALLLNRFMPLPFPRNPMVRLLGGILTISGFLLGGRAIQEMRRAGNSPDPRIPVQEVVEDGPYCYTRNPIYLGMSLVYVGLSLLARSRWPLYLLPAVMVQINNQVVPLEEHYLEERFGETYREYRARVRRWI